MIIVHFDVDNSIKLLIISLFCVLHYFRGFQSSFWHQERDIWCGSIDRFDSVEELCDITVIFETTTLHLADRNTDRGKLQQKCQTEILRMSRWRSEWGLLYPLKTISYFYTNYPVWHNRKITFVIFLMLQIELLLYWTVQIVTTPQDCFYPIL